MLSIQPYYNERFLLSKVGMAGVIIFLTSLFDIKSTLLSKQHYFIYFLALAMYPKFLFVVKHISNIGKLKTRAHAPQCESWSSCRCSRPSRQAKENYRIPNTHIPSIDRKWRKSLTCNIGIHSHPRGSLIEYNNFKKKSRLCRIGKTTQEN